MLIFIFRYFNLSMYDKKQILKLMQQFKKKNQAENKQARSQNSYKIIFPLKTKNQNFIPSKLGKKKRTNPLQHPVHDDYFTIIDKNQG